MAELLRFTRDYRPDGLVCVGDWMDAPEPARWNKGMAMEYAPTLVKGRDAAREMLAAFTAATPHLQPAERRLKFGNHDERIETYVRRYAPALASIPELEIEQFLALDETGWTGYRDIFEVAPGWVCAHGHEGTLLQTPGATALNLAKKVGKSVVCGHTHRAGLVPYTSGFNGKASTIFGMEVGHAMDLKKAHYLKTGSANWQQAFGLLYVDGNRVTPNLVPVRPGGRFTVEGRNYG